MPDEKKDQKAETTPGEKASGAGQVPDDKKDRRAEAPAADKAGQIRGAQPQSRLETLYTLPSTVYKVKHHFSNFPDAADTVIYLNRSSPLKSVWRDFSGVLVAHPTLENEIGELRQKVDEQSQALRAEKVDSEEKQKRIQALEVTLGQLLEKEQLTFLLSRVNEEAQKALLESAQLREKFLSGGQTTAFVMSIDIRRSTELMLKARRPEDFAEFITILCTDLMKIVVDCYGVFDKFTGDGILAFFPEFFSGADAPYYALLAAKRAHAAFDRHYRAYRRAFNSVLKDTGLGVGIDFGSTHLVQMAGGLTLVGVPVVYACRLGGAPPGLTLLNQPAYERVSERISSLCFLRESELDIKREGMTLAYEARLNDKAYEPAPPAWLTDTDGK